MFGCLYVYFVVLSLLILFFHKDCANIIYHLFEHKIKEEYKEKLKIRCNKCSFELIGFDHVDLDDDDDSDLALEVD